MSLGNTRSRRKGKPVLGNKKTARWKWKWCRSRTVVILVVSWNKNSRARRNGNLRYPVPIVVRGFRLLTIQARFLLVRFALGRPPPLFLHGNALSLNYERGTRLNSAERTKRRFKLNARLFHLYLSPRLFTCVTTPPPSPAFSVLFLPAFLSATLILPSRLFRFAVAFRSGCFSPGPFSAVLSARRPSPFSPSHLSFLRRM